MKKILSLVIMTTLLAAPASLADTADGRGQKTTSQELEKLWVEIQKIGDKAYQILIKHPIKIAMTLAATAWFASKIRSAKTSKKQKQAAKKKATSFKQDDNRNNGDDDDSGSDDSGNPVATQDGSGELIVGITKTANQKLREKVNAGGVLNTPTTKQQPENSDSANAFPVESDDSSKDGSKDDVDVVAAPPPSDSASSATSTGTGTLNPNNDK